jgi:hypothetical protein
MHKRGIAFTTCLVLFAAITTVPILLLVGLTARDTYNGCGNFCDGLAGIDRTYVLSALNSVSMAQGEFQSVRSSNYRQENTILTTSIDPEAGASASKRQSFAVVGNSQPLVTSWDHVVGDAEHLWVISNQDRVFEMSGTRMVEFSSLPPDTVTPPGFWRDWNELRVFVWNGKLCCVTTMKNLEREIFQLVDDKWVSLGEVYLPDPSRDWLSDDMEPLLSEDVQSARRRFWSKGAAAALRNFNRQSFAPMGTIDILPIGSEAHWF